MENPISMGSAAEGILAAHEIVKDTKLTWWLPSDLWQLSDALKRNNG